MSFIYSSISSLWVWPGLLLGSKYKLILKIVSGYYDFIDLWMSGLVKIWKGMLKCQESEKPWTRFIIFSVRSPLLKAFWWRFINRPLSVPSKPSLHLWPTKVFPNVPWVSAQLRSGFLLSPQKAFISILSPSHPPHFNMAPEDNRKPALYSQRLTYQHTTYLHHELPPYASWLTHRLLLLGLLHLPFPIPGTPFSIHHPPNALLSSSQENRHLLPETPTGPCIGKMQQPTPPPMFYTSPCLFPAEQGVEHPPQSENALLIYLTFISSILPEERLLHGGRDLS